jgi:hypothetical protein
MHHFCSNFVCASLKIMENGQILEEFENDICFCSQTCYYHKHPQTSTPQTLQVDRTHISEQISGTTRSSKHPIVLSETIDQIMTQIPPTVISTNRPRQSPLVDPLVGQKVAFSALKESWMSHDLYRKIGPAYLAGEVTKVKLKKQKILHPDINGHAQVNRGKKKEVELAYLEYEIRWNITEFQSKKYEHWINEAKVKEGTYYILYFLCCYNLQITTLGVTNYKSCHHMILSKETWKNMCKGEADFTYGMEVDHDAIEEFDLYTPAEMVLATPQDVEQLTSLNFEGDAYLPTPDDLYKHPTGNHNSGEVPETKVKEEYVRLFRHSAISNIKGEGTFYCSTLCVAVQQIHARR